MINRALRGASEIPQMGRVHRKIASEGTAQSLIGRNQRAQSFVDLAVFSLAALLHRLHREESYADSEEGNHAESEQSRKQRRPGGEV